MHDDEIIWIHNLMDISNGKYNYDYIYLKKNTIGNRYGYLKEE